MLRAGSDNDIDYELIHFKPTFTSYNKNQVGVPQGPQKGRDQLLLGQTVRMVKNISVNKTPRII